MANCHANKCSSNSNLISLPELYQVNNLDDEMKCKDGNIVLPQKNKLQLSWIGDFITLKAFVCNVMKLQSTWSQPGGDKKSFQW